MTTSTVHYLTYIKDWMSTKNMFHTYSISGKKYDMVLVRYPITSPWVISTAHPEPHPHYICFMLPLNVPTISEGVADFRKSGHASFLYWQMRYSICSYELSVGGLAVHPQTEKLVESNDTWIQEENWEQLHLQISNSEGMFLGMNALITSGCSFGWGNWCGLVGSNWISHHVHNIIFLSRDIHMRSALVLIQHW